MIEGVRVGGRERREGGREEGRERDFLPTRGALRGSYRIPPEIPAVRIMREGPWMEIKRDRGEQ